MNVRGNGGVPEIVRIPVMLAAKVKPGLGILMYEQGSKRANIADTVIFKYRSLPGVPTLGRQRMGPRPQSQQVHHHHLVVVVPAILQEAAFGSPSMRQNGSI